jgi:hypothetical protein
MRRVFGMLQMLMGGQGHVVAHRFPLLVQVLRLSAARAAASRAIGVR